VIRRTYRAAVRFLKSAGLVSGLLAFIGAWSILATFVPQGDVSASGVAAWAKAHGMLEPVVNSIGLHHAFTAYIFLAAVAALALSTALCSWQRTRVAIERTRTMLGFARADERSIAEKHELEIACDPGLSGSEVLPRAAEALARVRINVKQRNGVLAAVSSPLSVWGSPIFHWALLALMGVILVGNLQRSDGLMALAVGQTKADAPASYGVLTTGPLHDWGRVHRSFRLDAFEPDFRSGGIDRGAVPTVSVLDGSGRVIKTQRVYPNNMLHSGSVSINAPACGLAATLSLIDANGVELGRSIEPVDFSQTATDGTTPVALLGIYDKAGVARWQVRVTVPLSGTRGHFNEWLPTDPTARLVVSSADGAQPINSVLRPGQDVALPGGGRLRLVGIGWYSRLSIVDDWTTPYIYAAMGVAMLGLAITVLLRQQVLLATVVTGSDGSKLAVTMRLWRNTSTNRAEIERVLSEALADHEKGSLS
jgi:cytochrome c biogenesis protein ResB